MRVLALATLLALAAGCAQSMPDAQVVDREPAAPVTQTAQTDADNTAVNQRDEHVVMKTPIDQNENQADINITAEIRRRVVDTELSINAQNAKIITQDGKVMLRGPVKTAAERDQIGQIAIEVAGKDNVENMLEVEANP
jgi:hyperosmotically inducible protein